MIGKHVVVTLTGTDEAGNQHVAGEVIEGDTLTAVPTLTVRTREGDFIIPWHSVLVVFTLDGV